MSLLLDALKKAEREKQKAREAEMNAAEGDGHLTEQKISLDNQQQSGSVQDDEPSQNEGMDEELELVLDEQPDEPVIIEELEQEEVNVEVAQPSPLPTIELEKISATTTTVSDEALQLLVYKTNKKYRQRQRMVWGSLLSVAAVILLVAGAYYYYGVLEEVDALERKHKLAMQAIHAEPIKLEQAAAPVMSSDNVTKNSSPQKSAEPKRVAVERAASNRSVSVTSTAKAKRDISIQQTKLEDPINALLKEAWSAYNSANYAVANRAYEKVLRREPKNRDALLGMAAIAVKTADYKKAKESYRLLLKLDPRDQVAVAAMSNIDELSSGPQDESKLKFMLQQQPTATHLNFALGNFYAKKGKWPEAQAEYFKAWQGNSENADYVYNLAVSLDQLGKKNEALRFYKECLLLSNGQNISFSTAIVEKRIEAISVK